MRKLVYHIAMTLDGYIAHNDGSIDGFLMQGAHADEFLASLSLYDDVLMGRGTYELGLKMGLQLGQPAYPGLKHYIFSKSMNFENSAMIELIKESPAEFVRQLKEKDGKSIWLCGGGALAASLLQAGLIDEIIVKINPIIFGEGISLFQGGQNFLSLSQKSCKSYENGVVLIGYDVVKNPVS